MGWRGLASGFWVWLPALLLSVSLAETGNAGSDAKPDSGRHYPIIAQAETEAAGEQAPAAQGEASEQTDESADATASEDAAGEGEAVAFTEDFLNDPAHLALGKDLWESTCRACHGAQAYPGKAPKLRPSKYTPEFVYDRVTNGFRKMPPWKDVFTDEERMNIVAYVLSRKFSP
jgi:mono/diheme cytochrome c family protein